MQKRCTNGSSNKQPLEFMFSTSREEPWINVFCTYILVRFYPSRGHVCRYGLVALKGGISKGYVSRRQLQENVDRQVGRRWVQILHRRERAATALLAWNSIYDSR